MRGLILWCLFGLALVVRAEEEQIIQDAEDTDLLESLDEDARLNVARMLSDLFDFSDEDGAEHNEELGINREERAKTEGAVGEEKAMAIEPEDQARYNKFIDTFFRRLNADARSSIDPMDVSITPSKTRKGATKDGAKKGKKEGGKKSGNKGAKTSRASVSGIASLGRVGDVSVVNRKDGKELRTDFKIGPVDLKVNRRFGRSAKATSP
ncbi:unnamed protein product [Meganyctiphanes norvegica]|uniref:Uncharacterized protein n=1 Tax=Meganyctiphanes norvegica TaxID=48144 RepID=A0AAV2QAZ6_MEGNR